jgi:AcrR family transcriptional regulator
MKRLRLTFAAPAPTGPRRARTYRALVDCAMDMIQRGKTFSVAEVATVAGVARATAYRYFPSRTALISAIVEKSLGGVRQFDSDKHDGTARIFDLFDQTFPRFKEFEAQLRAALQLSQEHWAAARAGTLEEEPYRRGHRVRILERAAAPLRSQMSEQAYEQLLRALTLVYGIESYVVLKDIWGSSDMEVSRTARWMVDALISASLRTAKTKERQMSNKSGSGGFRAVRKR